MRKAQPNQVPGDVWVRAGRDAVCSPGALQEARLELPRASAEAPRGVFPVIAVLDPWKPQRQAPGSTEAQPCFLRKLVGKERLGLGPEHALSAGHAPSPVRGGGAGASLLGLGPGC